MTPERFRYIRCRLGFSVKGLAEDYQMKNDRNIRRFEQCPHSKGYKPVPTWLARDMERRLADLEDSHPDSGSGKD